MLLATASKVQALSARHAEGIPDVSVEVGDDGLPLGVFERHNLSPRRSARVVTHQQHLDSWRLTELRTFRQQQRGKEQEEEEKVLAAGSYGARLDADCASANKLDSVVPRVASPGAVQLQRKLTAECMVADSAASSSAAADSAVQSLFNKQKMPFKQSRKRPSMHSTSHALNSWPQHNRSTPTTSFHAKTAAIQVQPGMAAVARSQLDKRSATLEENLWAGFGGFGRNGRCRDAGSTAALQTPRPQKSVSSATNTEQLLRQLHKIPVLAVCIRSAYCLTLQHQHAIQDASWSVTVAFRPMQLQ